ncbi:MAG TPA: hypothetical protein VK012_05370 [Gemmatimonadales bacterium]|nr:hypothetical protein [Gemmatimonadales bacterium]
MNQDNLEDARQEAEVLLADAAADRRISAEVLELRRALIGEAPSAAAVAAIVADLVPTGEFYEPVALAPDPGWIPAPELVRVSAVFGTSRREGRWTAPLNLEIHCVLGEVHIDLRDAMFAANVLEVEADVYLGTVVLTVPAGTVVELECSTVLGSAGPDRKHRQTAEPNGLLVRVSGNIVLGELKTRERLPSDLAPPPPTGIRGWLARVRGQD